MIIIKLQNFPITDVARAGDFSAGNADGDPQRVPMGADHTPYLVQRATQPAKRKKNETITTPTITCFSYFGLFGTMRHFANECVVDSE